MNELSILTYRFYIDLDKFLHYFLVTDSINAFLHEGLREFENLIFY